MTVIDDIDTNINLPLRLFTLQTCHGTSVGFVDADVTRLVHGVATAREVIVLGLPHGIHLLTDMMMQVGAAPFQASPVVIPFRLQGVESNVELVSLRHPLEERYLSAHAHASTVSIDRSSPNGWEQFRLIAITDVSAMPLLTKLSRIAASYESLSGMIVALASTDCRLSWAIAAASLQFATTEMLKPLVNKLSSLPSYEIIFSALQRRLSDGRHRFEYQVNHRLAAQIKQFGWSIGDHSYGTPHVFEPHLGKLTIGKYCSMNDFVIVLGNHTTDSASSYPFGELSRYWPTSSAANCLVDHVSKNVVIGNDVWIGNGALVLPGTTIGDGAVIGAHAVAHGVIPPYAIVVGNPGRVIRRRFSLDRIDRLLALAWWSWPDYKVDRLIPYLLDKDVDRFLKLASIISESAGGPLNAISQ